MPVRTPIVIEIDRKTWLIQEYGLDCCYALLGNDSGLLIDTGCGRMPIRRLAERLFEGRPYEVALTHGHPHHAGGAKQFDAVRCGEELSCGSGEDAIGPDFILPEVTVAEKETKVLPLYTGDVFDLGGREVVCVRTPGHSEGGCSFYDGMSGIAFVGDACGREMHIACVADALTGLMRLKRMAPGLNRLYPGHVDHTDYRALPGAVLEDAIGACRAALAPDGRHYHQDGNVHFRSVTLTYEQGWAEAEPHSPYPLGL